MIKTAITQEILYLVLLVKMNLFEGQRMMNPLFLSLSSLDLNRLVLPLLFLTPYENTVKKRYYVKTLCLTTVGEKRRGLYQFSENFGRQIVHLGSLGQEKNCLGTKIFSFSRPE